jgi:DNA-binding Xre family transcriptional regulator
MRVRLPELLEAKGMSGHQLAVVLDGRMSRAAIYKLLEAEGHFERIAGRHLEALCHAFGVSPNELLEGWERTRRPHRKAPSTAEGLSDSRHQ